MGKAIEPVVNANSVSRISEGTVVKGEITSPGDIRIDGEFEGRIVAKGRVVIGESARIKGDIVCANIDLFGKLSGDVFVKDTLALKAGCSVEGNLNVSKLYVELGSSFNGNCKMISEEEFGKIVGTQTTEKA